MDMIRMSFKVLTIFLIYNNMVNGESDESDYDDYIQFEDVKHMTDNARRQIKNAKRVSNNTSIDLAEGYLKLYNENYYKSYFNVRSKKRNVNGKNYKERNVEFVKDEGDMNRTERDSLTRKLKVTERDNMTRRFNGTERERIRESYEEEFDGKEIAIYKRDKRNTKDNPFIITILLNKNEVESENRTIVPLNKDFKMRVVSEDRKIKSGACYDTKKEVFSSDFSNYLTENTTYFESNVKELGSKGTIDTDWNCIFKTEDEPINRKLSLILTNLHDATAIIYVNNNKIPTKEVDTYGKFDQIGYYDFENDELVKIQCKVLAAIYVKMYYNEIPILSRPDKNSEPMYIRLSENKPTPHIDCTAHRNSRNKLKAYRLEFKLKQEIDNTPSFRVNGSNALRYNSTYFTYEYVEGENLEISLFFKKPDIYKSIQCQTENDIDDIVTSNNPIGMNCIIEAIKKDRTLQCTIFKNTSETETTNLILNLVAREEMTVVPRVFVPLSRIVSSYSERTVVKPIVTTNLIEYSYKKNEIVEFTCAGSSKNSFLDWDYSPVQVESTEISKEEGINSFKLKDNYTISTIRCVENNLTTNNETKITLLLKKHEDTGLISGPSGFISNIFNNSRIPKSEGQTFFEEYWIYIVPASVAIFILIAIILSVSCFKRKRVYLVMNTPTQVNENSHTTPPPPDTKTVENAYATPFDTQTNNTEYQLPINHIIDKLYSKPVPKTQRQAKVLYATPNKTKNGTDNSSVDIKFDSPYADINEEIKRSNIGKTVADKVYTNCYHQDYTNANSRTELCDESVYYSEVKND